MKQAINIVMLAVFVLSADYCRAQDTLVPRFVKYPVGPAGCFAYFPAEPGAAELEYSPDSSKVYTISASFNNYTFGCITVAFNSSISVTDKETLLISYMDYLKEAFKIGSSAGYGKGHTMESHAEAVGVIDYWKDADGDDWAVKGWIDEHYIGFMYIYGKGNYPIYNAQQIFLDGFRFP